MDQASRLSIVESIILDPSFVLKHGARDEPDRDSIDVKREALRALLARDPTIFLERYGKLVSAAHLRTFQTSFPDDYEVQFHVKDLLKSRNMSAGQRAVIHRNRRLKYLKDHLFGTDYFAEDAMKRRAPQLYFDLVGQYKLPDPWDDSVPLSDRILRNMDDVEAEQARQAIQRQQFVEEEESDDDEESPESSGNTASAKITSSLKDNNDKDTTIAPDGSEHTVVDISPEERRERHEEFVEMMKRRFVSGQDTAFFDYSTVDDSPEYDDTDQQNRDFQDTYFRDDGDDGDDPADDFNDEL